MDSARCSGPDEKIPSAPGTRFSKFPVIIGLVIAVLFSIPDGSLKSFEYYTVKFLAKETKWTLLEYRTHPTFPDFDFKI